MAVRRKRGLAQPAPPDRAGHRPRLLSAAFVCSALTHLALALVAAPLVPDADDLQLPVVETDPDHLLTEDAPIEVLLDDAEPTEPEPDDVAQLDPPEPEPEEQPEPEQQPEPVPREDPPPEEKKPREKKVLHAEGETFIDQDTPKEENEPPPEDTDVLSAQDRRVDQEEQPSRRALNASEAAPRSLRVNPAASDDKEDELMRVTDAHGDLSSRGLFQVRTDHGFGTVCGEA